MVANVNLILSTFDKQKIIVCWLSLPVVSPKVVAEVSKIENLEEKFIVANQGRQSEATG